MSDLSPAQERAVRLALKLAHTNTEMRAMTDQHENQIATLTAELAEANRKLAAIRAELIDVPIGGWENAIHDAVAILEDKRPGEAEARLARVSALDLQCEVFVPPSNCAKAGRNSSNGGYCTPCRVRAALGGDHD